MYIFSYLNGILIMPSCWGCECKLKGENGLG